MKNTQVANLEIDAIKTMLANILHLSMEESEPLAELVYRQTCGNVFFVIQFLRSLSEEGLLYQDFDRERWAWEPEDKIIGKLKCSSVPARAFRGAWHLVRARFRISSRRVCRVGLAALSPLLVV
jgi:hypothetical protein